jgi:CheY-like chemotaxis protein
MVTNHYRIIRILQVEGNDRHAVRVRLHLYSAGLRCTIRRVVSREEYVDALRQHWPDVVLAGGDMPDLSAASALDIAAGESPYVPVVFAVMDFLAGLGDVVLGALVQSREIRGRRIAEMSARHEYLRLARSRAERTGDFQHLPLTGTDHGRAAR